MENNKNKKSVKFQGDMLNFCDFIQVFVFTRNHHLNQTHQTGLWLNISIREATLHGIIFTTSNCRVILQIKWMEIRMKRAKFRLVPLEYI